MNEITKDIITVNSEVFPIKDILTKKYEVDYYQREYVWQKKQLEDMLNDLSNEFLNNWREEHGTEKAEGYNPYFMGEIVLRTISEHSFKIIDGQQRLTTITLILMYINNKFGDSINLPKDLKDCIFSDSYGKECFNLEVKEREECMKALYEKGHYVVDDDTETSIVNIVDRYNDIEDCWNDKIDNNNINSFVYWLLGNVKFSKVWTNSDEFAYVIFETMNDRGLSLTQVEMLRSYILTKIDKDDRTDIMDKLDTMIANLTSKKLKSKSKAEFEFFKVYFRSHYAEDLSQSKNSNSDFIRIGKEFHRWFRDNELKLGLTTSDDFKEFVKKLLFYAKQYMSIIDIINEWKTDEYLHVVVNSDYGFTLQPALLLAAINYTDDENIIKRKIQIVSKYLTKVLSWRIWNHVLISQNKMEAIIYDWCKKIRGVELDELETFLNENLVDDYSIDDTIPTLNQQNNRKLKILLSLITEIVAVNSSGEDHFYNKLDNTYEVEHIWADHFERHVDEGFKDESEFQETRNRIGDLLVLPKTFNASYGDDVYEEKVKHYYSQNILAQTLCSEKYEKNPGFNKFKEESGLPFTPYEHFEKANILERTQLYREILKYHFSEFC